MLRDEWFTEERKVCANCNRKYFEDGKYCRYCGARKKEGKFRPQRNMMQCIYGPQPVERIRTCTKCPHTWRTFLMIDNEYYCPECGAPATVRDAGEEEA